MLLCAIGKAPETDLEFSQITLQWRIQDFPGEGMEGGGGRGQVANFRGGRGAIRGGGGQKPTIWQHFCRKLYENERN